MGTDAADYDNSGQQSLVIGHLTNQSIALYHNEGQGLFTNQAQDAEIALPSAKVKSGSSYLSQSELPLTFGLASRIPRGGTLETQWPGGHKEKLTDIHPDQFVTIKEGSGIVTAQAIQFTLTPVKQ